jgi:diguanylate cyclase (GGDEF)-like protein
VEPHLAAARLSPIARDVAVRTGAEVGQLAVFNDTKRAIEVLCAWGEAVSGDYPRPGPHSFVGRVLESGCATSEPINPDDDPSLGSSESGYRVTHAAGAAIGAPGGVRGALCVGFSRAPSDAAETLWTIESYARLASLCLHDPGTLEGLEAAALFDGLTGYLNRSAVEAELEREIARCERDGRGVSCCLIDLDHFGQLNDLHGHPQGSRALAKIARILRAGVRIGDTLGRYGDTEFLAVLPGAEGPAARAVAERLRVIIHGVTLNRAGEAVDVSIGTASWHAGCSSADTLVDAQTALVRAKAAGGGPIVAPCNTASRSTPGATVEPAGVLIGSSASPTGVGTHGAAVVAKTAPNDPPSVVRRRRQREEPLKSVQQAMSLLRHLEFRAQLLDRAPGALCEACGFERAIVFGVERSVMVGISAHFDHDPDWALEVLAFTQTERMALTHQLLETEMLRRRAPAIVLDPQSDPRTYKPLVCATRTKSYVAAPIMPDGRVIGFIHADYFFSDRKVNARDRDMLWTFTEGFGFAYQRTALLERLRDKRNEFRRMFGSMQAMSDELCDAELRLKRSDIGWPADVAPVPAIELAPDSRLGVLLTRRELEVLGLMGEGETNSVIADRLVIAEATVKSHVKHILRKLRAANRAEAVARYMRLAQPPHLGP